MRNDNRLGSGLLGQEGLVPGQISKAEREEINAMLDAQLRRARRMKWVAALSWALVAACLIVFGAAEALHAGGMKPLWLSAAALVTRGLLIIAILMTISWYVRHRNAAMTEIRERIARIEAQLREVLERR